MKVKKPIQERNVTREIIWHVATYDAKYDAKKSKKSKKSKNKEDDEDDRLTFEDIFEKAKKEGYKNNRSNFRSFLSYNELIAEEVFIKEGKETDIDWEEINCSSNRFDIIKCINPNKRPILSKRTSKRGFKIYEFNFDWLLLLWSERHLKLAKSTKHQDIAKSLGYEVEGRDWSTLLEWVLFDEGILQQIGNKLKVLDYDKVKGLDIVNLFDFIIGDLIIELLTKEHLKSHEKEILVILKKVRSTQFLRE